MSIFIDAVSVYCDNCDEKVELNTNIILDTEKENITHLLSIKSPVEMWSFNSKKTYGYEYDTLCPTCADEWAEREKEQEAKVKRMRHEAVLRSRNIEVTNTGVDVLADILNIPITKEEQF